MTNHVVTSERQPIRISRRVRGPLAAAMLSLTLSSVLALAPAMVAAQEQTGSISGRVTDETGSVGFAGAIIRIPELGIQTVSERDGSFRFRSVEAGTYTLVVSYVGAGSREQPVTVSPGESVRQMIALEAYQTMDEIHVYGQIAQARSAINQKRAADIVKDMVTADSIGQFPDQNVAEAARRVAGVTVDLDQGEGRFIVIRGSDPNLNAVSINGLRIPSSSADERQVGLDVLPAELLSSIEITKTVTPDMDGDAVGGSIQINTVSAFDRDGMFISGTVEGSYNELVEKTSPKVAGSFSNIFELGGENQLGVAIAANWYDRDFGSDNVENGDGWDTESFGGQEFFFPEALEQRDYTINRERTGLSANFDYRAGTSTDLYLRTIYSKFNDTEVRVANIFEVDDGDFEELSDTGALVSGDYVYEKDLKDRVQPQTIWSVNFGGETSLERWTFDYNVGYSTAKEETKNAVEAVFEGDFGNDVFVGYDLSNKKRRAPQITSNNRAALDDPANFELDEVEYGNELTKDKEWAFELNSQYNFDVDDIPAYVKFGSKVRLRKKFADVNATIYSGFPDDPTLATGDFATTSLEYSLGQLGAMPNAGAFRRFVEANRDTFEIDEEDTLIASAAEDYNIKEDIYAGYLMGQLDFTNLRLIAGVRMEHTRFTAEGTELVLDDDADTLTLLDVSGRNNYTDWLPSVNARLNIGERIISRAAFTKTLARPNFADVAPINERELSDGELEGTFGNPELEPYSSTNFDLSFEIYPGELALISVAGFYKEIKNFVVDANLAGMPGRFENFERAIVPINGDTAKLKGLEFSYQQQLAFLPSPFDGLLISANYTYADGSADLALGNRKIPLPRQSKHIGNFSLGYEKGPVSLRAAVSYRSSYLDALEDPEDPALDRYVDDHIQWDLTARYKVFNNFTIFGKLQNLNNRAFYAYYSNPRFNSQYETYGITAQIGITATY